VSSAAGVQHSSLKKGQLVVDLSGVPFSTWFGVSIVPNDIGCGLPVGHEVLLKGVNPMLPPQPNLPNLQAVDGWVNPSFPADQEAFTAVCRVQNTGGKPSGPFVAHMALDNEAQSVDVSVPSLAPGLAVDLTWPFNTGLPHGDHFVYTYRDQKNAVKELSKSWVVGDNVGYVGFMIGF